MTGEIDVSSPRLNSFMYATLRRGVFGSYERSLGPDKKYDCRQIEEGRVLSKIGSAEQVLWFNGEGQKTISVFARFLRRDAKSKVELAISDRIIELTDKRREIYGEVFGRHNIESGEFLYDRDTQQGVFITVPIIQLPRGIGGELSGKLFDYTYNIYSIPASLVAWDQSTKGRRWYVFDRPQPSDIRRR